MRPLLAALLALALAFPASAAPAPLRVSAIYAGDGIRVTWPPVAGATLTCVTRPGGGEAFGCARQPGAWRQALGSRDENLRIEPGQVVEVRAWREQELIAVGRAVVRWVVYVPVA